MNNCQAIKNGKARSRAFFLSALGVLVIMVSSLGFPGAMLVQLGGILLIVWGLQYLIRYELSDFSYILNDTDSGESFLVITRTQGKRVTVVAEMELTGIRSVRKYDGKKDSPEVKNRFNYSQNLGKDNKWVIGYHDGEKLVEVIFEPHVEFVNEIQKRMNPVEPQ